MNKILSLIPFALMAVFMAVVTLASAPSFSALAVVSSYNANQFSQFCSDNPSICNKVNFSGDDTVRTVSCPSQNQVVQTVYVHAGNGQTVYELPHEGFTYVINGNQVTVTRTTHPNNFSWIGVVCNTPSPSPTPTPSPTPSPSVSPSPSPSPSVSPTPSPTPSPSVSPSPSPSPSVSPTPSPSTEPGKRSSLGYNITCTSSTFEVTMDLIESNGKGAKDVEVTFTYKGETKKAKTNDDGRAKVDFNLNGDGKIEAKADGWSTQSADITMPKDCPTGTGGQVLGTSTDRGQVLGASTLAATGTADQQLALIAMGFGTLSLAAAGYRYGKQS